MPVIGFERLDHHLLLAEQVIDEHGSTLVPSDYFDRLLAALDERPQVIPELAAASRRVLQEPAFEQF